LGADPLSGTEGAGGEGIAARGTVGEFDPLADIGKMDGVVANDIAARLAEQTGGVAQSWVTEALFNMPATAHVLGGAIAGTSPENGVVDPNHRVFGYQNLLVCDGSVIPVNPGVNPSLTIAAMIERVMAGIPQNQTSVAPASQKSPSKSR